MQQPEVSGSLACVGNILCHPKLPSQLLDLTSNIVDVSRCLESFRRCSCSRLLNHV